MNRYRLIEAFLKLLLWIIVIIVYIMHLARVFEPLPQSVQTIILSMEISMAVILAWFMPSAMTDRKLNKGLRYLDKDNDKAARYFQEYLGSKLLTENERRNALRILGVANHKRGDDEGAIICMNQALEGHEKDNDLKVEILGAMGVIYSESGNYIKAVEHFDRTFDMIFAMSKAQIDRDILLQVMDAYVKAGQKDKAVSIYDRLLMIRGFKRNKKVEALLGLGEKQPDLEH